MAKKVQFTGKPAQVTATSAGTPTSPPALLHNVVVMVLDDVGTEWFEWMGVMAQSSAPMTYPTTPFLSWVADNGVWFDRASAEPTCGPARTALHTGQLANRTGFGQNVRDPNTPLSPQSQPEFGYHLPDSITFLAERLRAARPEIATAAFGKWHMADCYSHVTASTAPNATEPPHVNLDDPHLAGFQTFRGNVYNVGGSYTWWKVEDQVPTFIDGSVVKDETTYPSAVNATDAAAWFATQTGPFFAYVAIGAPHAQFTVPPFTMLSSDTQAKLTLAGLAAGDAFSPMASVRTTPGMQALWRSSIEATDTAFQRIYDSIPAEQRARTWFIVTGDNGTVAAGLPPGFLHTKRELYWGGTRVPFLVLGPGVVAPGRKAKQIVHVADIYRTVCELMNVRVPADVAQDSVSFVPVLRDAVDRENRNALRAAVYVQQFAPNQEPGGTDWRASTRQRGVFDGEWRLVDLAGVEVLTQESKDPLELSANRLTDGLAVTAQNYARLRTLLLAAMPE